MPTLHRLALGTAAALAATVLAAPHARVEAEEPLYVVDACVQGALLVGAAPAKSDTSARAFAPRYRLAGKKALVKEIKQDHAGHIDEFTGRTTGDGVSGAGKSMTLGKLGVRVGGAAPGSPNAAYVPETPVFQVLSFKHLDGTCR